MRDPAQRELLYGLSQAREKLLQSAPEAAETARVNAANLNSIRTCSDLRAEGQGRVVDVAGLEGSCSALEPYALRVLGDSMEPEFADGCVIIVDPGYAPKDGAYVIVEYAGDLFFGRLVIERKRYD